MARQTKEDAELMEDAENKRAMQEYIADMAERMSCGEYVSDADKFIMAIMCQAEALKGESTYAGIMTAKGTFRKAL